MPIYHICDLVRPNPQHSDADYDLNAVGLIIEMRQNLGLRLDVCVLWNDMIDEGPLWTSIDEVVHAE